MSPEQVTEITGLIDGNVTTVVTVAISALGIFLAVRSFNWIRSAIR